jgi:hypothetical protein
MQTVIENRYLGIDICPGMIVLKLYLPLHINPDLSINRMFAINCGSTTHFSRSH